MADAAVQFLFDNAKQFVQWQLLQVEVRRDKARADEARREHFRNNASSVIIDVHQYGQEIKAHNQIQRVPDLFRERQADQSKIYDPLIVSIGPYHHNSNKNLSHAEDFKDYSLKAFLSESHHEQSFYEEKLFGRIEEIRKCYEPMPQFKDNDGNDNRRLVQLFLRDACFLIYYMELTTKSSTRRTKLSTFYSYFGPARIRLIFRDLILLENQIPFWILEYLLCLQSDDGESIWYNLLCKFMSVVFYGESVREKPALPWADKNIEPFHFLEAYYETLKVDIPIHPNSTTSGISIGERNPRKSNSYRFRSITNLSAKGVQFKLSKSKEADVIISSTSRRFWAYLSSPIRWLCKSKEPDVISFTTRIFWGNLNLPALFFSANFFVIYSNLIAYEMFSSTPTDFFVSSFVNLLKSLIVSPNDVKILRENEILFNDMVTDDDVVKVIQDLDTFGLENIGTFQELRYHIEEHCRKKRYTWIAEFITDNFENPWKFLALVTAVVLLSLTIVQTYYTIHPKS